MVDVTDYVSGGEFISPADFENPFNVVVVEEPKIETKNFDDRKVDQLVCGVSMKEGKVTKKLTINKTNCKVIAEAWGNETSKWVGGVLEVGKIRVNVGGEKKWGLDLEPVKAPQEQIVVNEEEIIPA